MQPEDLERVDAAAGVEPPGEPAEPVWPAPDVLFAAPPEETREPFWNYFDLLLIVGLSFLSLITAYAAIGGWIHFHRRAEDDLTDLALPLQFVAYGLIYLSFFLVFKLKYNRPVLASLGFRKTNHSLVAAGAGGVLLAFGIAAVANFIKTPKVETPFDQLAKTPLSMALLALTAIVAAPLFEEMVFRGFLQPLLSRTFGMWLGILITALLFGGLHASEYQFAWQYVAAISIVGIALGIVRAKTNSTIPGTVMHGCFNAVSVAGLFAVKYHLIPK
jgi:hypothetical protein